jgi:hypothetical protein
MPGGWIGKGTPFAWPLRLTDLTPLDFSLWVYVNNLKYLVKNHDIQQLKTHIWNAVPAITYNMQHVDRV